MHTVESNPMFAFEEIESMTDVQVLERLYEQFAENFDPVDVTHKLKSV